MLEQANKPAVTIAHILTTLGLLGGLLAYVNATENKVERNEAVQEMMLDRQREMSEDFKAYRTEQRQLQTEQMRLLIQIENEIRRTGSDGR